MRVNRTDGKRGDRPARTRKTILKTKKKKKTGGGRPSLYRQENGGTFGGLMTEIINILCVKGGGWKRGKTRGEGQVAQGLLAVGSIKAYRRRQAEPVRKIVAPEGTRKK